MWFLLLVKRQYPLPISLCRVNSLLSMLFRTMNCINDHGFVNKREFLSSDLLISTLQ